MDPLVAAGFFVFGLAFGSFLNVCIHRMPLRILVRDEIADLESQASAAGVDAVASEALRARIAELAARENSLSIAAGRSACPKCGNGIAAYDNIPVLSWLILRGKCRQCHAPISPRYAIVELLTALLFLACYGSFGLTIAVAKYCTLSFLLLGLIFTDAEHKLLPDALTIPGTVLGLAFSYFVPVRDLFLGTFLFFLPMAGDRLARAGAMQHPGWTSLAQSAVGALIGASFIYGVGVLYLRARGVEGMGFGDVKLMALIGSFLGVGLTVLTLFSASFLASIFGVSLIAGVWLQRTRRRMTRMRESAAIARKRAWKSALVVYNGFPIPFGVFLGAAALAASFFGNTVLRWWWLRFL